MICSFLIHQKKTFTQPGHESRHKQYFHTELVPIINFRYSKKYCKKLYEHLK